MSKSDFVELVPRVPLQNGLIMPVAVVALLLQLETKNLKIRKENDKVFVSTLDGGKPDLSPDAIALLRQYKLHILACLDYMQ